MRTHLTQRFHTAVAAVTATVLIGGSTPFLTAAPADDISRAVTSTGANAVNSATAAQFAKAFTAVVARANAQQTPQYVTAAIKLRPDLAPQITAAALRARKPGNRVDDSCDWVTPIVGAAVAAAPNAAAAIVRAAVAADADTRECVASAAIAAAPGARVAILQAAGTSAGQGASTASFRAAGVDAGNINSAAAGTINPANVSARGNQVSPQQDRQTICHNGRTMTLPRPAAEAHLRNHSGDRPGPCGQ